ARTALRHCSLALQALDHRVEVLLAGHRLGGAAQPGCDAVDLRAVLRVDERCPRVEERAGDRRVEISQIVFGLGMEPGAEGGAYVAQHRVWLVQRRPPPPQETHERALAGLLPELGAGREEAPRLLQLVLERRREVALRIDRGRGVRAHAVVTKDAVRGSGR